MSKTQNPWNGGPGNKRDRAWFADLTPSQQEQASKRAAELYDGTRTVARCWREALMQVTQEGR